MTPTYSNAPGPEFPDYYILDVADIVEEMIGKWHDVISTEIAQHQTATTEYVYPEVYTLDPVTGAAVKQVYVAQHHQVRTKPWHPDVSFIMHHVIEAIKQRDDPSEGIDMALQLLEFDIATMTHHQLLPNIPATSFSQAYSDARMKIAKLAAEFGKKLFRRFIDYGLYKGGYFPYHFAGWQDTCALVTLDATHR